MPSTSFTDPAQVAVLYADTGRTRQRTSALLTAKISGDDATATIVDLAAGGTPAGAAVCEIGCGRGTVTLGLVDRIRPSRLTVVDTSVAFLDTVRHRAARAGFSVDTEHADFHHLPLDDASIDVMVAAFCLYHSPHPQTVVAEIARCLRPGGRAVLATKSADSYREIDQLIAEAGLDPHATSHQSLYETFHSANAAAVTSTALRFEEVLHRRHLFRFADFEHLAAYVATIPKYGLPTRLTSDPPALAAELRHQTSERPITTTSTVTYLTAARP